MKLHVLSIAAVALLSAACSSGENPSPASGAPAQTGTSGGKPVGSGAPTQTAGSAPAGASGSHLVFSMKGDKPIKVDVSGTALARQLNDGRFMIYVYSSDIAAAPTCDAINPSERHDWKGAQIGLVIYDFPGKTGKIKAKEALIEYHGADGKAESMDDLHGPDVDIQSFDGKTLRAKVVTPDPPEVDVARVDGEVVAAVCPPQK